MKPWPNKKSMQQPRSGQYASNIQREHRSSLSDNYLFELKEWIRRMINEAEKSGDIVRKPIPCLKNGALLVVKVFMQNSL